MKILNLKKKSVSLKKHLEINESFQQIKIKKKYYLTNKSPVYVGPTVLGNKPEK